MDAIEQEVRWLSNVLGKVRDLDVFIADALAPAVAAHGDDERLRELSTLARARQQAASDDLLEALAGARFRNLAFDLAAASIRPPWRADDVGGRRQKDSLSARRFAREQLARRHARVLKFGKRIGEMDSAARHRLRIKLKKLRYAAEFFGSMLPRRKTARFLARLSELQDVLGGLNDSTVARALTAELVSQRPDPAGADSIYAAGVVIGWRLGHARDHSHELERRWRKFAKTDWI
jgi:CHAD domain-containing protein